MKATETIHVGGLGPLSWPGIPWAGRELRDGMILAVQQANDAGGALGRQLTLRFQDTRGSQEAGFAAIEKLLQQRVHALAGEFHSVVADAIVEPVQHAGLPFVCASATLDRITARRLGCVFRLAPPQSYSWRVYADFLASEGSRHVVALQEDSLYWNNGSDTIEARLRDVGVSFTRLRVLSGTGDGTAWVNELQSRQSHYPKPDMLLLLIGYPEPIRTVVGRIRALGLNPPACLLGDPAGRAVFPDWNEIVGIEAQGIPFLSYARPADLTLNGKRVSAKFAQEFGREPTFVALEGYDSVQVLKRAFEEAGTTERASVCEALRRLRLEGTRGTIAFSTEPAGVVHQQWKWPPVCVVAYSQPHQPFSKADLLWDAEWSGSDRRSPGS